MPELFHTMLLPRLCVIGLASLFSEKLLLQLNDKPSYRTGQFDDQMMKVLDGPRNSSLHGIRNNCLLLVALYRRARRGHQVCAC